MPYRHAYCSEIIEKDNHVCPTCRRVITSRFLDNSNFLTRQVLVYSNYNILLFSYFIQLINIWNLLYSDSSI